MSNGDDPRRGGELGARITAARDKRAQGKRRPGVLARGGAGGMAIGLRIASELVAAIAVSVGIGLALDAWLGTKPWLMVLFVVLGTATGFYNVVRTAGELERRRKAEKAQAEDSAGDERQG